LLYAAGMNKLTNVLLLVAAVAAIPACAKKDDGGTSSSKPTDKAAPATDKAAPAADKPAASGGKIDPLKLAYDGPSGDVSDMSMGGDPSYMVMAGDLAFTVTAPAKAKTLDEALDDASMYSPTVTKKDKTGDGYQLEYNNTGSMGANYFVEIERTIGGKPYVCSTTASDTGAAAAAAKICQSLRAI
jgi:hypothetical protein